MTAALAAIARVCSVVPGWLYAITLAIALAGYGATVVQRDSARTALAREKLEREAELSQQREVSRKAEAQARAEEHRRQAVIEEIASESQKLKLERDDLADRARSLTDRLRIAAKAAAAKPARRACAAPDTGTAAAGAATDPTADLLAELLAASDRRATDIARFADDARAAGLACQAAYQALTP